MREVRAVVIGLVVVLLGALALAFWRKPAPEFRRVKGYRVEVREKEGDTTRKVSFTVPSNLVARIVRLAPVGSFGADIDADLDDHDVTPREILEAADRSAPGKPAVLELNNGTMEVMAEGPVIDLFFRDDWDKEIRMRLPREIIESLSGHKEISPRDLLLRLDELGPGQVVTFRERDKEITITAISRD
ncbi:MAG: fibronectin type III domain-containing protein [Thermoanaerobaculia bacterium]